MKGLTEVTYIHRHFSTFRLVLTCFDNVKRRISAKMKICILNILAHLRVHRSFRSLKPITILTS